MPLTGRLSIVALLALIVGCSGSTGPASTSPVAPPDLPASQSVDVERHGNRVLWGFWTVHISGDRTAVEVIPDRAALLHLNAVRLLEVSPCSSCLRVDNLEVLPGGDLSARLVLYHPFPGLNKFTGFDVRGIFISKADYLFPMSGRSVAWSGLNGPRLVNPDGYTHLYNPIEFPESLPIPAVFRYSPGKYSTGGDLTARLNPFVAYKRDMPRRMFEAGSVDSRTAIIRLPSGPLRFGYAVDASWARVDNVTDPLTDFPPEANCLEAYEIHMQMSGELEDQIGDTAPIDVTVFDHQGLSTILAVSVESPQLFSGERTLEYFGSSGQESHVYRGTLVNALGAVEGEYPVLIKVVDKSSDPVSGQVHAWQVQTVSVVKGVKPWRVLMWGGDDYDTAEEIALDSDHNMYVVGRFMGVTDLDPGSGFDYHTEVGEWGDTYLSKLDAQGDHDWGHSWGSDVDDTVTGVAVDVLHNVYVVGAFRSLCDFDPGDGVDERGGGFKEDAYISKFDWLGKYQWVRNFEGPGWAYCRGVATDSSGMVYICGEFDETIDLWPGPLTDERESAGLTDVFLCKLDGAGQVIWAHTWGGTLSDYCAGISVDGIGNIYVVGTFSGSVDFDPGPGQDIHSTAGGPNDCGAYFSKFGSGGSYLWGRTWGGGGNDRCLNVDTDSAGNIYAIGEFDGLVDFDPGPEIDQRWASDGPFYLTKFDANGNYLWVANWGQGGAEMIRDVAADGQGGVYVLGMFVDTIDLLPGAGECARASNGMIDVFLSKFLWDDQFLWGISWGGPRDDLGLGVCGDSGGNSYVAGVFQGTVDFCPGPDVLSRTAKSLDAYVVTYNPDGTW